MTAPLPDTRDRTWVVALAAGLWGTDGLLRMPLVHELPAATIVLAEHAIVVALTLPLLAGAVRRAGRACGPRDWAALAAIGVGSSAVATVLFTEAFRDSGPITPLALQKLQPLFAVAAAAALLGERVRARYGLFFVAAVGAAWLLAFPHPGQVTLSGLRGALLAVGAAALWAAGTVLGRMVSGSLGFRDVTMLRYGFGLLGALGACLVTGDRLVPPAADAGGLVGLALVPGLLALLLYYFGLQRTAASRATIAELAFPATAAVVGVTALGAGLTGSQWVGLGLLAATVTAFAWNEQRPGRAAVPVAPPAPWRRAASGLAG